MFVPLKQGVKMTIEPEDQPYVNMINKIQKEKAFYFSYDIDLTKNIQTTVLEIKNGNKGLSSVNEQDTQYQNELIFKEAYPNSVDYKAQYVFNANLLKMFPGIEYSPFMIPCIFGYVFISDPNFSPAGSNFKT